MSFEQGDKASCLAHTETILTRLRPLLCAVARKMNDPHIARAVWARHIGGVHGWAAAAEDESGGGSSYSQSVGGLSGSRILLFGVLDAFLGIAPYQPDGGEKEMHMSRNMRRVCMAVEAHSFRGRLGDGAGNEAIGEALDRGVKQLRVSEDG